MNDSFDIICSKCNFKLENISNRYPYVILDSGEHHYLETLDIESDAEKVTGQSYDSLTAQKRTGEFQHYLCNECATDALIDRRRSKIVCPECKSKKLSKVAEMDRVTCPLCRYGRLSVQNHSTM